MDPSRHELKDANDVFISYSRKDKEFARSLEKALESYKPPKDLNVPHKNLVVFRDEGDFTGVEYHESIERHLGGSTKMILICSPHARNSSYVNEEVSRFVRTKGVSNVIPLLLSGIPNNEARSGQEYEMAFPDALLEVMEMPIAVNYIGLDAKRDRVDKGSFYGSWCTLLANFYNLTRSEIEQRDKKRQARVWFKAISMITVVIVALLALSVFAWISRGEAIGQRKLAEEQRAEAVRQSKLAKEQRAEAVRQSKLAEEQKGEAVRQRQLADEQRTVALKAFYQLTYKIPLELEKFPRTEKIRENLVRESIGYLDELQKLTPESLDIKRELATNHRLLGAILEKVGRFQEALEEYRTSASFYEPMLRQEPTNAFWYRDLFVSYYNSGRMLDKLGDKQGACKEFLKSIKHAQKAAELDQRWAYILRNTEVKGKTQNCAGVK